MPVSRLTVPLHAGVPGEWCDVDYNPRTHVAMLGAMHQPSTLVLYVVSEPCVPEAAINLGRWGLYLRMGIDDAGRVGVIMQDGRPVPPFHPAIVVIYGEGGIREIACPVSAFGQNCVEIVGLENGWLVWVLVDPVTVWRANLSWDGQWSNERRFTVPQTSQGFTDGERNGTIRMLDAWRFVYPGMVCPAEDLGLVVGQAGDPDRMVGQVIGDPKLFTVHRGTALEPHVVGIAEHRWLACARSGDGPVVVALQAPFQAEAPPPPPPPPPPDPQPEPEPEEPTVSIPNHFDTAQRVAAQHEHLLKANTPEACTELLWRIIDALNRRDQMWGLVSKSAGEKHCIIGGERVAIDAITYGNAPEVVDIFVGAHDAPNPTSLSWQIHPRRPSNVRVTPPPFQGEAPGPRPEPEPEPGPDPKPTDPRPPAPVDFGPLLAELMLLNGTLLRVEAAINGRADQVVGKIDELQRDVQKATSVAAVIESQMRDGIRVKLR